MSVNRFVWEIPTHHQQEGVTPTGMTHTIGIRIRDLRKQRSVAQATVAEAVGISRSYLAGIETGKDLPGRETLMALADYFGVDLDWLASTPGQQGEGVAARTAREAVWLHALRSLPDDEADDIVQFALRRIKSRSS